MIMNVWTLFNEMAERYPTRIAISDRGFLYGYRHLSHEVEKVAAALVAAGCQPHTRVCLAVTPGVQLVASVLAVLKLGATYVPVDTRHPIARIQSIVADSEAHITLSSARCAPIVAQLNTTALCVDDLDEVHAPVHPGPLSADALAYILYTSGSTGAPKGVGITHANLMNYVAWARDRYFAAPDDRIALYTTLAFDFTVTCIFPPLLAGASIGIHDGVTDPMAIRDIINDRDINIIKITPSYLQVLAELLTDHHHIRLLIVGGEDLKSRLAATIHAKLRPAVQIINEYGPTEATVGCLFHVYDPEHDQGASVPIGVPIPGVQAHILDEHGVPVHDDREGELYLSGVSVASGYLKKDDRSRAAFLSNPFQPGSLMYKTGDLVRRDPHGALVFCGRRDDQVKIRGNRVELSEVANALLAVPMVTSAYVTSVVDHASETLAAVVTGGDGLNEADILAALKSSLPSYMIPTTLRVLPEIPLTSNQKIDRAAVLTILGKRRG